MIKIKDFTLASIANAILLSQSNGLENLPTLIKNHYVCFKNAKTNDERILLIKDIPALTNNNIVDTYLACIYIIECGFVGIIPDKWAYQSERFIPTHGPFYNVKLYNHDNNININYLQTCAMEETNYLFRSRNLFIGKSIYDDMLCTCLYSL